ncbi:TetR/AcrR family transcriptional regulator [Patulibacter sp. SYSU D01012]|uniref:TetR/AcrR family transcriptional regulator n=1 Tax=Patulibacter sp. SYSU D01012 TaxID=2817381 RepID=UPI001B312731
MARWEPDAPGRLRQAALALFDERGYEATTVADIAERAGLTKRTFFRHYADKREVLFDGSQELLERFVAAVIAAPESAAALDAIAAGLDAAADLFEARREPAAWRMRIVESTPELQERELIKLAAMADGVTQALRRRGVGDPAAALAAEAGIAVFRVGFSRWVAEDDRDPLRQVLRDTLDELRAVAAA